MNQGYTYFIQSECGGPIKVGFTKGRPQQRLMELQTGSPLKLKLVGWMEGNSEREVHAQLHWARLHGEWFLDDEWLIEFINENAVGPCPIVEETGAISLAAVCSSDNVVARFAFFMRHPQYVQGESDAETAMQTETF